MKKCSYCGRLNHDEVSYCLGCGTQEFKPYTEADRKAEEERQRELERQRDLAKQRLEARQKDPVTKRRRAFIHAYLALGLAAVAKPVAHIVGESMVQNARGYLQWRALNAAASLDEVSDLVVVFFGIFGIVLFGRAVSLSKSLFPTTSEPGSIQSHPNPQKAKLVKGRLIRTNCNWCGQPLQGTGLDSEGYHQAWTVGNLAPQDIIGYICPSCGAVSHTNCKQSGIGFKTWTGFKHSFCKKCQAHVPEPIVVLPTSKAEEAGVYQEHQEQAT